MLEKKYILGILLATVLIIGGSVLVTAKTDEGTTKDEGGRVAVESISHDWGEIGIESGKVEKVFSLTNTGEGPLRVLNVSTSCMCTTAQLLLGEKESPLFGMHTKDPFVLEISPRQTASLKVVFDPAFHGPSGIGEVTRQIHVETTDPTQKEITFDLTANVTPGTIKEK